MQHSRMRWFNRLQLRAYKTSFWKVWLVLFILAGSLFSLPLALGHLAMDWLDSLNKDL